MMNNQTFLITGGCGFIGNHFIKLIFEKYPNATVINLDALTYASAPESLASIEALPNYHFVKGSICDRPLIEDLLKTHQINIIVNFAAESHVDRSISGPASFIETNILGTFTLLEAAKTYWLEAQNWDQTTCRFHHISTDEVYGSLSKTDAPFSETHAFEPNSPYSASKASSDHLVRAYQHTYGLPTTVSNCSNNYGTYQNDEKLIPTIIRHCLAQTPIPIYGDGQNIRDWLHVKDHCKAVMTILESGEVGNTYNIGSDNEWDNLELTKHICKLIDKYCQSKTPCEQLITFVSDRPGHDKRYAINANKIQTHLNWQAQTAFTEGLEETIAFYAKKYQEKSI